MNFKRDIIIIVTVIVLIVLLFVSNLYLGDADIPLGDVFSILSGGNAENEAWSYIVEYRLNRSIIAVFGGGALAISGLILQVFFRNPLAGPGVLGITSGASLGVALVILGGGAFVNALGGTAVLLFGALGAIGVLFLLLFLSKYIKNQVTLLVIGLMISYFTSAFVNMLYLWSNQEQTREFVIWGLGSFEGLSSNQVLAFTSTIVVFLALSILMIKGLNALVLGEDYARSLGIDLKLQKTLMIVVTSVLAAVVTTYCGPISFIGIAVPQLIRIGVKNNNHAFMLPAAFLGGALLGLTADIIVRSVGNALPLNTVTALIGAPIIIWTIIKMNKRLAGM
ncbi:iron ABC transporter permease [Paracrocinitomix mangrovi]|uniref:FecCD family ABC transporter permease n=1 Tax=Paracrocinitomix mangrovi TaxID=2862509 RepID=UPI001C8E491E|nr:iron ABC transporter permease [Paracrocinitomix mangrovi]UKN01818.1 iron ABC transporter permease [Paracrocinitomix mangrovi]